MFLGFCNQKDSKTIDRYFGGRFIDRGRKGEVLSLSRIKNIDCLLNLMGDVRVQVSRFLKRPVTHL